LNKARVFCIAYGKFRFSVATVLLCYVLSGFLAMFLSEVLSKFGGVLGIDILSSKKGY
jgi:hypothetical protein